MELVGKDSGIQWTTHTFNPWRGCTKVSPGCTHCYAEAMSKRNPAVLGIWGDKGTRVVASQSMWRQPPRWDDEARETIYRDFTLEQRQRGDHHASRPRVFCASLADVFEDRDELFEPRARLFDLIDRTPYLDWLLLTKRPDNIRRFWPEHDEDVVERDCDDELCSIHLKGRDCEGSEGDCCWHVGWLPRLPYPVPSALYRNNVWLGTTVEDCNRAEERIPILDGLTDLCPIRFLSMEPLLELVSLSRYEPESIDWVIVGGESGPGARPYNVDWAREIIRDCRSLRIPVFHKQVGARPYIVRHDENSTTGLGDEVFFKLKDSHGGNWEEWTAEDLKVRQFPRKES
jgi:protein gp37